MPYLLDNVNIKFMHIKSCDVPKYIYLTDLLNIVLKWLPEIL